MKKFLSVLLAVMMVLSSVSFAAPTAVMTSDFAMAKPEATDADVPETAILAADTWYDLEKGTLLYNMDFETDNGGSVVTSDAIANVTRADGGFYADQAAPASGLGRLNPDVTASTAYTIGFRYVSNSKKSLEAEGDNHYLSLVGNGSNNISFYLGYPFQKAGKYTLEFKYKLAPTSGVTLSYIECNTPSNTAVTDVVTGEWGTFSREYNVTGAVDSLRLRFIPTSGNITSTDALLIDEVKVYFYDPDADYESLLTPPAEITDTWYDITKGTKLYQMDFDANNEKKLVTSDALTNVTNAGGTFTNTTAAPVSGLGRLNPDLSVSDYTLGFRYATNGSAKLVADGNNKYFAINGNGSDNISFYLGKPFQKAGKYVLELKYKYDSVSGSALSTIDCNTPSNGTVSDVANGEWKTFSKEYNVTGASDVRLRFCVSGGSVTPSDTLCFDDIVVWYYDESVDYDDMFSSDIIVPEVDWDDEEKGQKLFTMDFSVKNDGTAIDATSYDSLLNRLDNNPTTGELVSDLGRINPDVDGSNYRISFNYINGLNTELINDNGNVYLSVAPDGTKGDVSLYLGGFYGEEGTYTIETSYKFVKNGEYTVDRIRYETLGGLEYTDASYLSTGNWVDLSETHEHTGCSHGNVNRTRFTTNGYNNTPFSANDRIYVDNITVYFKAPVVEEPDDGGDEGEVADEWDNTEKGYRVFLADFETKNDGTAVISTDVSAITNGRVDSTPATAGIAATSAARVNPEYSSIARLNVKGGAGATIQGTADNQHLTLTSAGDSLILSQLYVGDGTYVIEFDANSTKIPEVRGSYSEGTVPTTQALDGTWTRYTFVSENVTEASSKSCSSYHTDNIRFYFGTAPTMYDNLVLYYQPAGWTPPSEGGEEGGEGDEPAVSEWIDAELGNKLFVIDLDGDTKYQTAALENLNNRIDGTNDNVASNGLYIADIGRTNPEYASYEGTFKYSFKDGGTPVVEGTDDKYFKHTVGGQASVMVANPFVGAGTYTLVFNHNANVTFKAHSGYMDGTISTTAIDDNWAQTSYTVDISAQGNDYFRIYANNAPGTYTIDDVALFYKPEGWTPPSTGGGDEGDDGDDDGNWTDEEKGNLLYTIDFTTKNDGTEVTLSDIAAITSGRIDNTPTAGLLVQYAGRVNPKYSNGFRVNVKDAGTSSITGTDNKYLTQTTGTAMSLYVGSFYVGEGRYTVEFDTNTASGAQFAAHSGFTGGTLTKTSVDGTWSRYTYTFDASQDLSYIRFLSSAPSNEGRFMFDNINVYFKETMAKVTVKSNGNANVSDTLVGVDVALGAKVGAVLANVDTSKSTKYLLGASLTENGEVLSADYIVKPSEVKTLYLIWGGDRVVDATPWYHEEGYGKLLFDINWDGALSSTPQPRWADVKAAGAAVNPDFYLQEKMYFMWGSEDIGGDTTWIPATSPLIEAEANGNRFYKQPHAQTYNEFGFYAPLGGDYPIWAEAGVFTIKYDIKLEGNITVAQHFVDPNLAKDFAVTKTNIRLVSPINANNDGWQTVVYTFDASEYATEEHESLGKLVLYTQTNESSAVANAYILYDNIQVYWKPSTVKLTLNPGTNLEVTETSANVSTMGEKVSEILSKVDLSDTTLVAKGIKDAKGNVYGLNDTVNLLEDATFYIVWEENTWMDSTLGMLIQKGDFESAFNSTGINRWPAIEALGATKNPEYNYEGIMGLQFTTSGLGVALDENSMWIPANYKKTENGNSYFEFPIGKNTYDGKGHTNLNAYAMGKGASQYQYEGAGVYTVSAKVKFPAELDIDYVRLSLNAYTGEGVVNKVSTDFKDLAAGEWHEISATWTADKNSQYGLGSVELYFFYEPTSEKINIAVDDFNIYFKPFTADVTLRANNNPAASDIVVEDMPTDGFEAEELLSYIRSPLGGMELVGLAYDKAGKKMLEGNIVIGGDTRYFMIWEESEISADAPEATNECSIRTDDPAGLRFKAEINKESYNKADRVGWTITRYDLLEAKEINPHEFDLDTDVKKVTAFNKDTDGTSKIFDSYDGYNIITAVLYNIPEKHYATTLVARPFTVIGEEIHYGYPIEASLYEIAKLIEQDDFAGCTNDQKAYIMNIIEACEA